MAIRVGFTYQRTATLFKEKIIFPDMPDALSCHTWATHCGYLTQF
jgi:hypothetical protein